MQDRVVVICQRTNRSWRARPLQFATLHVDLSAAPRRQDRTGARSRFVRRQRRSCAPWSRFLSEASFLRFAADLLAFVEAERIAARIQRETSADDHRQRCPNASCTAASHMPLSRTAFTRWRVRSLSRPVASKSKHRSPKAFECTTARHSWRRSCAV